MSQRKGDLPPRGAWRIIGNLAGFRAGELCAPCELVVEAGIRVTRDAHSFYQADLAVTCTREPSQARAIVDPVLIVEVWSPSTRAHDRGVKLFDYRAIDSVHEILLVSSEERRVEHWRRKAEGWRVVDHIGEADVPLTTVAAALPLARVYAGVDLDAPGEMGLSRG